MTFFLNPNIDFLTPIGAISATFGTIFMATGFVSTLAICARVNRAIDGRRDGLGLDLGQNPGDRILRKQMGNGRRCLRNIHRVLCLPLIRFVSETLYADTQKGASKAVKLLHPQNEYNFNLLVANFDLDTHTRRSRNIQPTTKLEAFACQQARQL